MSNITDLRKEKKLPVCAEVIKRLSDVLHEYDGEIGLAEAIGILELMKHSLINDAAAE